MGQKPRKDFRAITFTLLLLTQGPTFPQEIAELVCVLQLWLGPAQPCCFCILDRVDTIVGLWSCGGQETDGCGCWRDTHPPFTLPNLPLHTLKWGLGLRMAPVVSLAELLAGSHVLQGQLHFWQNRLCPVLW